MTALASRIPTVPFTGGRRLQTGRLAVLSLLIPGLAYLVFLFYIPIVHLVILSFTVNGHLSLGNYSTFFGTSGYVKSLEVTIYLSLAVVVTCAVLGYLVAYRIATLSGRWANVLMIIVAVPFWSSVLVRGFAWTVLLEPGGAIQSVLADLHLVARNTDIAHSAAGLVIGMTQVMLPYMVFPVVAALRGIDRRLPDAARSLGANSWWVFWRVTLPLSMPGVVAGCLLVFLINVGFYVLPELLGAPGDMFLSQIIDVQVNQVLDWGLASAMAVVLVAVTLMIFALYARVFGLDRLSGAR
jgi:ABC-type spermidine/putrescine transport system permease subunit I